MIVPWTILSIDVSSIINPWSGCWIGSTDSQDQQPLFYNPRALTLVAGTMTRTSAAGSSKGNRLECMTGADPGSQTGSDVDLNDPDTSVNTAIGGTFAAPADHTFGEGRHLIHTEINNPAGVIMTGTLLYEDTADNSVSYFGWGNRTYDIMTGVGVDVDRYTTFGCYGLTPNQSQTVTATESQVQMPWPSTGTFKYLRLVYGSTPAPAVDPSVELALRLDGADTALVLSLPGTSGLGSLVDDSTPISVTAGQKVSWRITRKDASATFIATLMMGFIAS